METNDQGRIQEIEAQLSKLAAERSLLLKELSDLKKNNVNLEAPLIGRNLNFHSYKSPESKNSLKKDATIQSLWTSELKIKIFFENTELSVRFLHEPLNLFTP